MAGGFIRGVEYIVTDADWSAIAVVRPIPRWRARTMPHWAEDNHWFVVMGPDSASGLAVTAQGLVKRRYALASIRESRILVQGRSLIGIVEVGHGGSIAMFRDCTCGQRRRECRCGGRKGKLLPGRRHGSWMVVDDEGHQLAHITPHKFAIGVDSEDARARALRWARMAQEVFLTQPKKSCDVVEASPGFDWYRHGLLVVLAALCDPSGGGSAL